MRKLIGKYISIIILFFFAKKRIRNNVNRSVIYSPFFHRPNPLEFEKIIQWFLKNDFEFISTNQLDEILVNKIPVKKKFIWLTFDDGWRNNYIEILPILKKYDIPATIFVSTNLIEEGAFWLEIARLNQNLFSFPADNLKKYPENKRTEFMKELKSKSNFIELEREFMTWTELNLISNEKLISIGNHTHNHVICSNCSQKELESEYDKSNFLLRKHANNYISAFAYPNGNFNNNTQVFFKSNFKMIALVENVHLSIKSTKENLSRVCLGDKLRMEENILNTLFTREVIRWKNLFKLK